MNLTDNARVVLEKRYLQKDPNTQELIETPNDMCFRVAKHAASAEATESRMLYRLAKVGPTLSIVRSYEPLVARGIGPL